MDLNIASLQQAYAANTLTLTDVVNEVHRRVTAYTETDPGVWIDTVPLADLLARADQLTELRTKLEAEGKPLPALWGVSFSAKNNMDVKGFRTTAGCRDFSYVAERTATCVQRCLDAGGILVGTTNLDQFATGLVGQRSDFTNPRCVYDADYVTGGSSSGCAVSVAAQLVSL
jgi:allophanate hydrolase